MSDAPPAELCLDEAHSDAAFLSGLRFAPDAPDRLLAAARKGRPGDFVRRLADNSRSQRQWPSRTVANACIQASWLLPAGNSVAVEHLTRETLLAAADGLKRKAACNHVAAMLDAADQTPHLSAEVTAAWLTLIPTLASRLDGDTFFRLWRRTLAATERIVACEPGSSSDPLDVSPELQDEILFRAGCVFAPLADASHWLKTARHNWRSRLDQTDEEHVCPALAGRMLIAWVGSLTRTTSAAFASEVDLWKKRHVRLLRQLARDLTALLFANRAAEAIHGGDEFHLSMITTLAGLSELPSDDPALQLLKDLRRGRTSRPRVKGAGNKRSSRPGWQSDVRQFALLRDVWSPDANVLSVDYAGGDVQLNFSVSGQQLLSGCWTSNVLLNDQLLEHPLAWKCECWFSDRDADFVELTADLGEGIALMRQLLLARKESMLLVAEAIRGASPETRLTLRSSLPTVPDLRGEPDGLTRELQLTSEPIRLRVFPLHLPWERTVPGTGRLSAADAALECEVAGNQGVCQVVVLDWSDAGGERPADGTPLSVVEAGRPLSPGEACAGRVRIGQNHWFYLHNLTRGQIPRSVAGHHTDSETVIGKLDNEGDLHLLVHVEGDAGEEESEQVSGEKSE